MPQNSYYRENDENNRNNRNNRNNGYNNRQNQNRDNEQNHEEVKPEQKVAPTQNRDVTVDLKSSVTKTRDILREKGTLTIANLQTSLAEVNNMLVEFYDNQINAFGAQGIIDKDGNPYNATNYSTPEEKLNVLEAITRNNVQRKEEFNNALKNKAEEIKTKKKQLKEKANEILTNQKEAIDYNLELIKEAEIYIHNKELEVNDIEAKITKNNAKISALENDKTTFDAKRTEIQTKLADLNARKQQLIDKINEVREKELSQGNTNNGKQKNMQNAGYYQSLSQELKSLNDQIVEQELNLTTMDDKISSCSHEIEELRDGENKALTDKSSLLTKEIDENNIRLSNLKTSTQKLVEKHSKDIETLNDSFKEKIKGFVKDDIKLDYSDKEVEESDVSKTQENNEKENTEEQENQEKNNTKGGAAANAGTPNVPIEANLSERDLANNIIDNLKHTSAEKIRFMLNGAGYSDIIDALDASDINHKKDLVEIIKNAQADLEIPDYDEFINCIDLFTDDSRSIDPDEVYDSLFSTGGNLIDFNSLNKKQIDTLQKVMDCYSKARLKLSAEQLESFDSNFAQFVKMGSLVQRGKYLSFNNGIKGIFNNIFNRSLNASRNRLLYTMSDYSETRFKDLNSSFKRSNDLKASLGGQVVDEPKFSPTRGNIKNRGLRDKASRGEI